MGAIICSYISETITSQKTYSALSLIQVTNTHATDSLRLQQANGTYVVIVPNAFQIIQAPTGQVLPDITILTDSAGLEAQIIAYR